MQSSYLEDLAMNARFVIELLNPKLRSKLMKRTDPSYKPTLPNPVVWNPLTLHRAFFLLPFPLG